MSQNLDTQIIYDKNGKPIPQYLDITDKSGGSDGTMKPITGQNGAQNMRLTGSIVELTLGADVDVASKKSVVILDISDLSDFKEIRVACRWYEDTLHRIAIQGYPAGTSTTVATSAEKDVEGMFSNVKFDLFSIRNQIIIRNNTDDDKVLRRVTVLGVK